MPRQPPLPSGLPPRPMPSRGSYDTAPAAYRPRDQSPPRYRDDQQSRVDMYHFKGAASAPGNSYRPQYGERERDRMPSPPRYAPHPPSYHDQGRGRARLPERTRENPDSYRPSYNESRAPSGGFTFRQQAPPAIDFDQGHTYQPPARRENDRGTDYNRRDNTRNNASRNGARGGYRGRGGPRMASERDFLKTNRAKTPELMPGMDIDHGTVTYKDVATMSDSEEVEMDLSDEEMDSAQPRKKYKTSDGDSVPRWSNPDPYTVLPPPDAAERKKKDVVKLIRKSRVSSGMESAVKTEAATDDFISLDFGGEDEMQELSRVEVEGAPLGPRSPGVSRTQRNQDNISSSSMTHEHLPPRPSTLPSKSNGANYRAPITDVTSDPNLGSRKRTRGDVLKAPPQIHGSTPGKGSKAPDGRIVKSWLPVAGSSPNPWVEIDHSESVNMGVWLHKEIMDFYHYVKPRDFEQVVRQYLVDNLREKVKEFKSNADIMAFGSFPAGLYLPTADMDLVCVSSQYMNGGRPVMSAKRTLFDFADFLRRERLALDNKVEVISKAKVPLVKYVCATTGLKVDISFENTTGLEANGTFQDWKTEFPAMPILVTLIKHLLAMRGLNEPFNGGIGGFSVICLVVSLLQHMPQVQSGSMIAEHHLGEILMEFLDLYGNEFNTATTAIQMKPPAYISKSRTNLPYKRPEQSKFSIIDPNRSDNDISGGSSNTATIRRAFAESFDRLQQRMSQLQYSRERGAQSLLYPVIGGNYRTFDLQREHLLHVHDHLFG